MKIENLIDGKKLWLKYIQYDLTNGKHFKQWKGSL